MLADLKKRAGDAVELAKAAGADDVWAVAQQSRNVQFAFRDGSLETVKDNTSRVLAIQIYAGDRYSSSQTTDLNPSRLAQFIREAVATARALEPDPFRKITPPNLFAERSKVDLDLVDPAVGELTRERRLSWCGSLDAAVRNHKQMISATSRVSDGTSWSAWASSNGFEHTRETTSIWLSASLTLRDRGDKRVSGGFGAGGQHVATLPPTDEIAQMALDFAHARLGSDKGPTTTTTMVVDARVAGQLIGRRLLAAARASQIQQGRSFWSDLLGKPAFSPVLTIVDNPLIPRGLASRHYDNEGISSKVLPIIEEGVVRNIYVDTYYGRKTKMAPTTGSSSNVTVKLGSKSLQDLVSDAGTGIYVTGWLGGNADTTTGDFSFGLQGHLIEGGKIGAPVSEMNVTGNLKDLFNKLALVGNDPYPYARTITPSLLFSDVVFSGA